MHGSRFYEGKRNAHGTSCKKKDGRIIDSVFIERHLSCHDIKHGNSQHHGTDKEFNPERSQERKTTPDLGVVDKCVKDQPEEQSV